VYWREKRERGRCVIEPSLLRRTRVYVGGGEGRAMIRTQDTTILCESPKEKRQIQTTHTHGRYYKRQRRVAARWSLCLAQPKLSRISLIILYSIYIMYISFIIYIYIYIYMCVCICVYVCLSLYILYIFQCRCPTFLSNIVHRILIIA
jgi:hypothetical protein